MNRRLTAVSTGGTGPERGRQSSIRDVSTLIRSRFFSAKCDVTLAPLIEALLTWSGATQSGLNMSRETNDSPEAYWVYLDQFLIDRLRINKGLSRTEFLKAVDISANTLKAAFRGEGIRAATALELATFFGCRVTDLLSSKDPLYKPPASAMTPMTGESEWQTEGYLEHGRLASNGLYYITCRMQHRHTSNRHGRGKFYLLSALATKSRNALRDKLARHADVCARVGSHPNVAFNLTSTPVTGDAGWWVIDNWVGEQTLADHLKSGAWPAADLPRLLLDVATGLQALHTADVVFRELAPARVLISDQDGRAVLTDFELAKLLDGSPSVSSEWPEDPYRAPEVDGGSATVQADLYSFGKLAIAAAAGELVDHDAVPDVFSQVGIPKRLAKLLIDCTEPVPARRPAALAPLLKELTAWQKKATR